MTKIVSKTVRLCSEVKEYHGTTSTKTLLTDSYRSREVGKIICINQTNFEARNNQAEYERRLNYNLYLESLKEDAARRVKEIERIISASKFINEYTSYVDKIEESAPQLMDALTHVNDLITDILAKHTPHKTGRQLSSIRTYSESMIEKIYDTILTSYDIIQSIARLSEFNSIKVIKDNSKGIQAIMSELSTYYMTYH